MQVPKTLEIIIVFIFSGIQVLSFLKKVVHTLLQDLAQDITMHLAFLRAYLSMLKQESGFNTLSGLEIHHSLINVIMIAVIMKLKLTMLK